MADEKPIAELIVGDPFWLAYAQDLVKAAVEAPVRRAEQLANGIVWFWTVYSAVVLVLWNTHAQRLARGAVLLLALPVVLLMAAYWLASRVQRPIEFTFDPRVPSAIKAAHQRAALQKRSALAWAELATALAALVLVAAVFFAALTEPPRKTDIQVFLPRGSNRLLVNGAFPQDAPVCLQVRTTGAQVKEVAQLARASAAGELHAEVELPEAPAYRVTATWKDGLAERTLSMPLERKD